MDRTRLTRDAGPTAPAAQTSPAELGGASALKASLRGHPFDVQESMLSPGGATQAERPAQRQAAAGDADKLARIQAVEADNAAKFRTAPAGLDEQLALQAAQAGEGRVIMAKLADPRLEGMNVVKLEYAKPVRDALGRATSITIHWFRDTDLGRDFAFKFKNEPFGRPGE